MNKNKLNEGVLCSLKIGKWEARAKINTDKLGKNIPSDIIRGSQDLIEDKSLLHEIRKIKQNAKNTLLNNSLPFPIDNVFFVPKSKIQDLNDSFEAYRKEYNKVIEKFVQNYLKLKRSFKRKYPKYFNENKYPSKQRIKAKFYFYWNFFNIDIPNKKTSILPPSLYQKEVKKFKGMVSQIEYLTINVVSEKLLQRVKTLEKQCKEGKINKLTLNSIDCFLEKWEDLWSGYVDEKRLNEIIKELKKEVKKNGSKLKNSEELRNELGEKLDKMVSKIENIDTSKLKRRLDI